VRLNFISNWKERSLIRFRLKTAVGKIFVAGPLFGVFTQPRPFASIRVASATVRL